MRTLIDYLSLPIKKLFNSKEFKAAVITAVPPVPNVMTLKGDWNATTNSIATETVTGSVYRVVTPGSTNLGGITDWKLGDLAVKTESSWIKIDSTDAMTSFNNRTGAVTLTSPDVVTALGFGPANKNNTVTVNGVSQTLASNPNFTIASGTPTVSILTSTDSYISQGDSVMMNNEGYAVPVREPFLYDVETTTNNAFSTNASITGSAYYIKTVPCPLDPDRVAILYSTNNAIYLKYGRYGTGGSIVYDNTNSLFEVAYAGSNFDVDWNPFNPNELIVIYVSSSSLYCLVVSVDDTKILSTTQQPIYLPTGGGPDSSFLGIRYSKTTPNYIVTTYIPNSTGYLTAQGYLLSRSGGGYMATSYGEYVLDTVSASLSGNYKIAFDVLDNSDTFILGYQHFFYINGLFGYTCKSVMFKKFSTSFGLELGTPYTLIDSAIYPYSSVNSIKFVSPSEYLLLYSVNNNEFHVAMYNVTGLSTNYQTNSVQSMSLNGGYEAQLHVAPKSLVFGVLYKSSTDSSIYYQSGYINFGLPTLGSIETILSSGSSPDYVNVQYFYGSGAFMKYKDGVSEFLAIFGGNSSFGGGYSIHAKYVRFKHISKKFNKSNLVGIANEGQGYGSMIEILPFGSVSNNGASGIMLSGGTLIYLHDNGDLSKIPSDTLYGVGLDYSKIKTVSYPSN